MCNLLKMDLYRLRRYKLTYVLLGLMALMMLLTMFITAMMISPSAFYDEPQKTVCSFPLLMREMMMNYHMLPLLLAMFLLLFLQADRMTGFLKTVAGYLGRKLPIVLTNLTIAAIYLVLLTLVMFVIAIPGCLLMFDRVTFEQMGGFICYLLLYMLLTLAYCALLLLLADLTGKYVLAMIFGSIYAIYAPILYALIDFLHNSSEGAKTLVIEKYLPFGNLVYLSYDSSGKDFAYAAIWGVVILVGSAALDVLVLKKKDLC
jgi:hypothetical protein